MELPKGIAVQPVGLDINQILRLFEFLLPFYDDSKLDEKERQIYETCRDIILSKLKNSRI